jgi:hypothetical protein
MERDRFDALTRVFAKSGSRRAALGALLGAGLLGTGLDALANKGNGKSKRKARGGGKKRGNNRKGVKASSNDNANLGNSVCAKWCHDNFDGKEAGQCTAAAAKGEGPCYESGGPKADSCESNADCCAPQVCNTETQKCVVPCGDGECGLDEKCCNDHCIAYDVCCTGNLARPIPVPGVEGKCLPKTNDQNRAAGDPHVNQLASDPGQVVLEFVNPHSYPAFFEVRLAGEKLTCGVAHPVVIGDWRYAGENLVGGSTTRTYDAEFVEVRLALGADRDHDFSSDNGSGWVRFDDEFPG